MAAAMYKSDSVVALDDSLLEDDDKGFSGTLAFANDVVAQPFPPKDVSYSTISRVGLPLPPPPDVHQVLAGRPGPVSVRFEISEARVEHGDKRGEKFVLYTITVMRSSGPDNAPAKINRRYSDFDRLNTTLHKQYPKLLKNIQFPTKRFSGNFKAETIAVRSRAFEQYLSHLFSIDILRMSTAFTDFLYGVDMREGYRWIHAGRYEEALCVLLHTWKMQAKILGDYHTDVISTLCAITACYCAIESLEPARTYADLALACISASAWNRQRHDAEDSALAVTCPPLVPLLKLSIWLCWKLGRDKKELEARLHELKIKGYDVDGCPTLLELVINWFKS